MVMGLKKILEWTDTNLLFVLTGFLLAFIPLYPKLPLFDVIPGYIVRVRLEDFLVLLVMVIWIIQMVRKKASFGPNPLSIPILTYLLIGFLSTLSAIFITKTVPYDVFHIGKLYLHFFRRIEYFSLFFIFFTAVKTRRQLKIYLLIIVLTVISVSLYGYGQKYLYWPAFSTMNREYAKGWALYLTQHARVISTFGGHYDLAAFVMIVLILLWSILYGLKNVYAKIGVLLGIATSFWLLILTASRTSFIAYMVGITLLFFLWTLRKGLKWALIRWGIAVFLSMTIMLTLGDLSERFTKLLKIEARLSGIKSLLFKPLGKPPSGNQVVFLENNIEAVTSKSDFPPLPVRPGDVIEDFPDGIEASKTASGSITFTERPRTYSKTALVYDLSTGIRLDALWPRAIEGFKRNPILGSGYSTLTKIQIQEFTEAESTDNDYLRALGETGLLGFFAFGWILFTIIITIWKKSPYIEDSALYSILVGLLAIIIGLLVNAIYIDVFEASKVAFFFWALTGIILGGLKLVKENVNIRRHNSLGISDLGLIIFSKFIQLIKLEKTYIILLVLLAFVLRNYNINEPLADWHSWRQADTSAVTRNYVRYGIDPLFPRYDDVSSLQSGRPNPQGYRFVEFPIYNILSVISDNFFPNSVEYAGRLTSVIASLGTLILLFKLTRKYYSFKVAFLTGFFFAVLPYNIYWSRVILPEPTLVFFTTALLYWFDSWLDTNKHRYLIIASIMGAFALLIKFTTLFFIVPILYMCWKKWGIGLFSKLSLYIFAIAIITPFILWRLHISQFPEGIPAFMWLFNGNNIRFKGAFFWWLFAERIDKLILGGWGVVLLVLGLVRKSSSFNSPSKLGFPTDSKQNLFYYWLLGLLLYLVIFATGNVQHDYYQIILVPIISFFLALGADLLLTNNSLVSSAVSRIVFFVIVLFMLMFGWYQVRDFYNINHPEIIEAGAEFNKLVDNDRVKVIAPYGGDTAFLYQTNRMGWPIMEGSIDDMIAKGAHYYISVKSDDLTNELDAIASEGTDVKHQFKLIKKTNSYIIIQLVPDKLLPKK